MSLAEVLPTNIYLFITATVLAILEIQIEGQHGWAKNLPTWRPHSSKWYVRLYSKMMSGKEMTGYHVSMFAFVLLLFHLPYVFGLTLTLEHWLKTFSFFFIFVVLWDFLWFVLNPHYPLKQFKKEHLSFHHKEWFLGMPTDYWGALVISLAVLLPAILGRGATDLVSWWAINWLLFGIQTIFVVLFSLYVLQIDKWHGSKA